MLSTLVALIVAPSVWVLIPPFPSLAALVGKPNSALVAQLGPWKVEFPDKFIAWDKSRDVARWTLEAGYRNWPVQPGSVTEHVKRCLWIEWAGATIFCKSAGT